MVRCFKIKKNQMYLKSRKFLSMGWEIKRKHRQQDGIELSSP